MTLETLYHGRHIRMLRKDGWEYVERVGITGLVALVPVTSDNKLVMVEQYRLPVGKPVIELPAGLAGDTGDSREPLSVAARRELIEETGYDAGHIDWLTRATVSPGLSGEVIDVYLASELKKVGAGGGDESESIVVHEIPLDKVDAWLDAANSRGQLVDLKVQMGLYYLLRAGWPR